MAPKAMAQKRKSASLDAPSTKKPKTSKSVPATKVTGKSKSKAASRTSEPDELVFAASDSEDGPTEDQTAALLKGFESESSDSENANDNEDGAAKPLDLSLLPDPSTASVSKTKASAGDDTTAAASGPTVLYISRVPHGFHETQMTSYFEQFGTLTHLRLARNRTTGRSRHFAFLQFSDAEVASIVARTMNNYLLFGHVLKCRVLPWEDVARMGGVEQLFRGSGRRWKKVPWNAIERNRVKHADRDGWQRRVKGEEKRRRDKAAKLKELGYEFKAPEIRSVADVPVKAAIEGAETPIALEDGTAGAVAEIEASPATDAAAKDDSTSKSRPTVADGASKSVSKQSSKKKKIAK